MKLQNPFDMLQRKWFIAKQLGGSAMMEMFLVNASLVDVILSADELTWAELVGKGMIMVDTCNAVHKFWWLLIEQIRPKAIEKDWNEDTIKIFEGGCWRHLRNIWFGVVTN